MRPVRITPLLGQMDSSSQAEEVKIGQWRYLQNMGVTKRKQFCFLHGFDRNIPSDVYNNEDLHDQLFGNIREPITFLYQAVASSGYRKLYAGTSSRLYCLNNSTGNWIIISDALGEGLNGDCSDLGWSVGQVKNALVFSNGRKVVGHIIDQAQETDLQSVFEIKDLKKIGLSGAELVSSFRGFIILLATVMDGEKVNQRIVWSDKDRPFAFVPKVDESAAGRQDLDYGEHILAAAPVANSFLIYTNRGIWEGFTNDTGLTFRKRFSDDTGATVLTYRKTLVQAGDEMYYMGRDAIYKYSLYDPAPEAVDWMFKASASIFETITSECNVACSGYDAVRKNIWFSWGIEGDTCPSRSIVMNRDYHFSSFVDVGFTAFCNYGADRLKTVRDWLVDNCICTLQGLADLDLGFIKEGGYCTQPTAPVCTSNVANIYTGVSLVIDDVTVEDYTLDSADEDALCQMLTDDCNDPSNACSTDQSFIGVYNGDNCIKRFSEVFYRERCTTFSACSTYVRDSYDYIIRSGPIDFGDPERDKIVSRIELSASAVGPSSAGSINLTYGASYEPSDPNTGKCNIVWHVQKPQEIHCQSSLSSEEYKAKNIRPNETIHWPLFVESRHHFVELFGTVEAVNAVFSGLAMFVIPRKV